MKKRMLFLVVLVLCLFSAAVLAETLTDKDYTNVTTAMTQDSVLSISASEGCTIEAIAPDASLIALMNDMYTHVWEKKNSPASYYDEETRQAITAMVGGNIDALHMSEAMLLQLGGEPVNPVTVTMNMDVDYQVGQLVVAVMGALQEDGSYEWYPYSGRVENPGEIKWDVPAEDWVVLSQQPVSLQILTDRAASIGDRHWGMIESSEVTPPSFSKEAGDVNKMIYWYTENNTPIEDNFNVQLVPLTDPMQSEVARIGEHVANGGAILDYFPADRKAEALLMVPEGIDPAALIPYDIVALTAENYKDTYGDVNVEILFGTDYQPEKDMISLAGFPIKDAAEAPYVDWYVLRTKALETSVENEGHPVEIGMKQLNLIRMMEEPIMLVVVSEPLVQE